MIRIDEQIVKDVRESEADVSQSLLYMLAIYFGLDHSCIDQETKDKVHRLGLVSRNYKEGGKPILTKNLIELPQSDEFPIQDMVSNNIAEWIGLWPKPTETGLTYSISGNTPQVTARMRTFINTAWDKHSLPKMKVPEKWKVVMEATKAYLAYQKSRGWAYTKKNVKFIGDLEGSVLAEWCQKVLDKQTPKENTVINRMI